MAQNIRRVSRTFSSRTSSPSLFFTPPVSAKIRETYKQRWSGSGSFLKNRIASDYSSPIKAPRARLFNAENHGSTSKEGATVRIVCQSNLLEEFSNSTKNREPSFDDGVFKSPRMSGEREDGAHDSHTPVSNAFSNGNIDSAALGNSVFLEKHLLPSAASNAGRKVSYDSPSLLRNSLLQRSREQSRADGKRCDVASLTPSHRKPLEISRITLTPTNALRTDGLHHHHYHHHHRDQRLKSCEITEGVFLNTPFREELVKKGLDGLDFKPRILGRGGFGVVVLALYGGKEVAVKLIQKNNRRRHSIEISIHNEENALDLVHHPNLVQTLGVYALGYNYAIVVMEYAGSVHLTKILEDPLEVMTGTRRLNLGHQVASGLRSCHQHGILHLDVKPANVMVSDNDLCKLGDFGCSRRSIEVSDEEEFRLLGGTVAYRAPELLQGKTPSCKADVYSFAVTMWQILTREMPFNGVDQHVIIYKVVSCDARPESPRVKDADTLKYIELYEKLWARDESARLPVDAICQRFEEIKICRF